MMNICIYSHTYTLSSICSDGSVGFPITARTRSHIYVDQTMISFYLQWSTLGKKITNNAQNEKKNSNPIFGLG